MSAERGGGLPQGSVPVEVAGEVGVAEQHSRRHELEALFRAEQPGLLRLAYLLVRDRQIAEEIVQEAFVRIYARLGEIDQPGAYLRRTVVNLSHGHGRRTVLAARHATATPGTASPPNLPADLTATWAALELLPVRQRSAIVLRFYLDLADQDIADLLDARVGTVRSLISRGLAALREELCDDR